MGRWSKDQRRQRQLHRWRRQARVRRWWDTRRERFGIAGALAGVAVVFLIYPGDYDPAYRWVMAGAFLLLGLVVATEWKPLERIFTGLSLVAWVLFGLFAVAGAVRGCPTNCV